MLASRRDTQELYAYCLSNTPGRTKAGPSQTGPLPTSGQQISEQIAAELDLVNIVAVVHV